MRCTQRVVKMLILCYHELSKEEISPWILHPNTFAEHLEILIDKDYQFRELPGRSISEASQGKQVVITFDDGTKSCIEYAQPILARHNICASFYICPGFQNKTVIPYRPTKFMNWVDIQELGQHHRIGAHSLTHCIFNNLSHDKRLQELVGSKAVLEDRLGRFCHDFATPYGYVDDKLITMVENVGFSTLVTTELGLNHAIRPSNLRRWEIHSPSTQEEFISRLDDFERSRCSL